MSLVSNTGPLVALAKVDRLDLLQKLAGQVYIPLAVQHELFAKTGAETARLSYALQTFIETVSMPPLSPSLKPVLFHLDSGEQEAVALAYEKNLTLIIDERLGRKAARQLRLNITWHCGNFNSVETDRTYPACTSYP